MMMMMLAHPVALQDKHLLYRKGEGDLCQTPQKKAKKKNAPEMTIIQRKTERKLNS